MSDPVTPAVDIPKLDAELLSILVCPLTRSPLRQDGETLVASAPPDAGLRYPIREGIPVLLADEAQLPEGLASLEAFKQKYASFVAPPA
ncbi:MAG: Trm112 family protein [Planctomycetota bacterium]